MKYLTRIRIGKGQAAKLMLKDAYAWHKKLWQAFPGCDGKPRDFLFRIDDQRTLFRIYLLSTEEPQKQNWGFWETKKIGDSFLQHTDYIFDLRANPTFRRLTDRRRIALLKTEDLGGWLNRKAEAGGFKVRNVVVSPPIFQFFRKNGHCGKHVQVDFRGKLSVTDQEVFTQTFERGIGSAKGFGFGMLMLQPVV